MFTEQDEIVTTSYLASYSGISRPFLRRILQKLNQAGILKSQKGKKGGFQLAKSADKISLLELIEIFQGEFQLSNCYIKGQECPLINDCPIRKEVEKVQKELINDLSSISLKVLITKNSFLGNEKYNKE